MEPDIDYAAITEQLQHENERLREQLADSRQFDLSIERVKLEAARVVQSPYFWVGYFIGIVIVSLINRLEDM